MATVSDLSGNAPINAPSRDKHVVANNQTRGSKIVAVVPSDTVDLVEGLTWGLACAVAGTVTCIYADGTSGVVSLVANANTPIRIAVRRVMATGTTATGIVAFY